MGYLTRQQAMEFLHIGSKKMWELTKAHRIPFYQATPGGKMLFDETDLRRYMDSTRVTAPKISPCATLRKRRTA